MREIKGENIVRNFFLIFGGLLLILFILFVALIGLSWLWILMGW